MSTPEVDQRSPAQRTQDEQIAADPQKPPLELPADALSSPVETHLGRLRRPLALAVAGVVENGVVRPLDPAVKLAEHARVIIVMSEQI